MHEPSLREDVSRESNNSEEIASPRMIDNHLQPEQADDEALSVKFPTVKLRRMNRDFMKRVLRDGDVMPHRYDDKTHITRTK